MKIAWFCIPAHGHTNPTLGLVKALTEAGHKIYYFSFEMFREKIENAGAVFKVKDLDIDGKDIISLGVKEGPEIGEILIEVFNSYLEEKCPNSKEFLMTEAQKIISKRTV